MCFPSLRNQNPILPGVQCLEAVALNILHCFIVAFCGKVNPKPVTSLWLQLFLEVEVLEVNFENEEEERKNRVAGKSVGAFVKIRSCHCMVGYKRNISLGRAINNSFLFVWADSACENTWIGEGRAG